MKRQLPKYLSAYQDRHGKTRYRFRRAGQDHTFKTIPWTTPFMEEYQALCDQDAKAKALIGVGRAKPGSFSFLIAAYYGTPEFLDTKPSTQTRYRYCLERFREQHGEKRVAGMERHHIKAILGSMSATPEAANTLLDRLRMLMSIALDLKLRKDDPSVGVKGYGKKTDGFHTWTEEEIDQFRATHPIGSKPRLALALLLYTSQRRSDVIRMGWQHVSGARIAVIQQKTKARLHLPIIEELEQALAELPRTNLTFLMTDQARPRPFSEAGFGNWFRDRCNEAGLRHCSAHGLRKAAARRMAESGHSNQEIKLITGHKTDTEVAHYTAAADQKRLSAQTANSLGERNREQ